VPDVCAVPRLCSLATAVPPHRVDQGLARGFAADLFAGAHADLARLLPLFHNAGIEQRHLAMPPAWYRQAHGLAERNRRYLEIAEMLLLEAAEAALARAGLDASEIDAVVTVSSTGIATPSLEARIGDRLGLRGDVERTPLFGLGCAGGVLGLARAGALARARPGARVLLLVVELCSLTLRHGDRSKANLVACALFGDGAAAAVLASEGDGPRLSATGERRWPASLDVMGWTVEDDGLGVLFAVAIPQIVRARMAEATAAFLATAGLGLGDVDRFVCHPGGARVIEALEESLGLGANALADARAVLARYGNMSAPTVLFVLERALADPTWRRGLISALGPGFSVGFGLLER
jgi:alkylresorcinol/alkylpyrone synthase